MTRTIRRIAGRPIPLRGDDVDTDRIIPARFLRSVTFEGLDEQVFVDDRKANPRHPFDDPRYRGASVLLVNRNFGCGSSREHAPQALCQWGIRAIAGESFSEIFFGNAVALGLPCVTAAEADILALMEAAERAPDVPLVVDLEAGAIQMSSGPSALGLYRCSLPPAAREAFLTGAWDATGVLLDAGALIEGTAARLPYLAGF